jgi:hypothetical protein
MELEQKQREEEDALYRKFLQVRVQFPPKILLQNFVTNIEQCQKKLVKIGIPRLMGPPSLL